VCALSEMNRYRQGGGPRGPSGGYGKGGGKENDESGRGRSGARLVTERKEKCLLQKNKVGGIETRQGKQKTGSFTKTKLEGYWNKGCGRSEGTSRKNEDLGEGELCPDRFSADYFRNLRET